MITVITPFSRKENIELMANHLKDKCNWIVLIDSDLEFPNWVNVNKYNIPDDVKALKEKGLCISNYLFNLFLESGLDDETQYMILCDDDFVEEGFWDKIPDEDVVVTSMHRGYDILIGRKENMSIGRVGGEQIIVKGKMLKNYRYGLGNVGDGEMAEQMARKEAITYVPDAHVLFNYLEEGRHRSFRDKPVVLFIGDYYCAGNPAMGLSEWEGNLWASLESTGLADVARFHMDKYYYHTGNRGDEALLERVRDIKPDHVVLIIYKQPGSDPTVPTIDTISKLPNLITIWGDLEAVEQRQLTELVQPACKRMFGTANKEVVERMGYKYMHVPKNPLIFNNPDKERDIDVVFSGSFGYGRPERKEVLEYLVENGISITIGGSEGGDHFTTEEYADRYKRAKIALSFSQARGMNVVNARPFEVMSCGAMLLEQKSPELAKLYEEEVDYGTWTDKVDLLEKVRYYLRNEEERLSIAKSGQEKTEQLYSAKNFWEEVLR